MSELNSTEYNQRDIFTLGRWIDCREGIIYLLDPATGEPLSRDRPPSWLASDERLAEGYEALGDPTHLQNLLKLLEQIIDWRKYYILALRYIRNPDL